MKKQECIERGNETLKNIENEAKLLRMEEQKDPTGVPRQDLTKELVIELSSREGVQVEHIEPHTEKQITVCGPMIIIKVID